MEEKTVGMKEAAKLLGCSVRTLQRRHRAGGLKCVFTPGGRRRIPESEVIRLQYMMGLKPPSEKPKVPEREMISTGTKDIGVSPEMLSKISADEGGLEKEKLKPFVVTHPAQEGLLVQKAVDRLRPATLVERMNYRDLLAVAARLGTFSHSQLAQQIKCSPNFATAFCERLVVMGLGTKEGGNYRLLVKVI